MKLIWLGIVAVAVVVVVLLGVDIGHGSGARPIFSAVLALVFVVLFAGRAVLRRLRSSETGEGQRASRDSRRGEGG